MSTDHDRPEPPDADRDEAVHTPTSDAVPGPTARIVTASQRPDVIVLDPVDAARPMRCPEGVWAMLVSAVDIADEAEPDRADEVVWFTGCWVSEQPPPSELFDGDLVVRLSNPATPLPGDDTTDVEMLLAYRGRWWRAGHWSGVDEGWPRVVAPTAAAVMALHGDASEATTGSASRTVDQVGAPGQL